MKMKVTFYTGPMGSGEKVDIYADFPEPVIIGGYEIQVVHDDGLEMPIIMQAFHIHEDSRRYHTICRRTPDADIDEIEW